MTASPRCQSLGLAPDLQTVSGLGLETGWYPLCNPALERTVRKASLVVPGLASWHLPLASASCRRPQCVGTLSTDLGSSGGWKWEKGGIWSEWKACRSQAGRWVFKPNQPEKAACNSRLCRTSLALGGCLEGLVSFVLQAGKLRPRKRLAQRCLGEDDEEGQQAPWYRRSWLPRSTAEGTGAQSADP